MSLTKHGMLTAESLSDFDTVKKAEYFDDEGFEVADEDNKSKLKTPKKINQERDNNVAR